MSLKQAKIRQIKNITREILYYERVYPGNTEKITELQKKLEDLVN